MKLSLRPPPPPPPRARRYADGTSLAPLVRALGGAGAANDTSRRDGGAPLVFKEGAQAALIDNEWKLVEQVAAAGQCTREVGSGTPNARALFNLDDDPTESVDRAADRPDVFANLSARLDSFLASVAYSAATESQCAENATLAARRSAAGRASARVISAGAGAPVVRRVAIDDPTD